MPKEKTLATIIKFSLIAICSLFIFRQIFTAYFFMDDFYFLRVSQVNDLKGFINLFLPTRYVTYRPLSTFVYFFIFQKIFGLNPLPYSIFGFFIHLANSWLIYKIASRFLRNSSVAWWIALIYVVSPLHFVGLYSIISSNFLIGFLFFLLSFWFWSELETKSKKMYYYFSLGCFILALLSSEIMMTLPILILLLYVNKKNFINKSIKLIPFYCLIVIIFLINYSYGVPPKSLDFKVKLDVFPSIFRWYILRAFGLPEGIRNGYSSEQKIIYILFSLLLLIIVIGIWKNKQQIINSWGKLFKYLLWMILVPFPFYFMFNHLNPIYFSLGLLGFLLIIAIILPLRFLRIYSLIFVCLSFFSIRLLMHTHWTVKRSNLSQFWLKKVMQANPRPINETIIINAPDEETKEELINNFQDDEALKVFYHNHNLKTIYKVSK